MKVAFVFLALLTMCLQPAAHADEPPSQTRPITNLVEILDYVSTFSKALDIEVPQPLTTNDVSWIGHYHPLGGVIGLRICDDRYQFVFDVRYHFINTFTDRKYAMHILWRAEDIKPLIQPSKISEKQALEIARTYFTKLGYSRKKLPPLLPPEVHQWTWDPSGVPKSEPLPFFTIEWRTKINADSKYCIIEIDGFREKVTSFSTLYPLQEAEIPR
jgi:hypothetical protein